MLIIISHWRNLISTYVRTVYCNGGNHVTYTTVYLYCTGRLFFISTYIALDAVHLLSKRVHQCTLYQTKIRIST